VTFPGTVQIVRINPTTVANVVTYDAVITVNDASGRLYPGMTAQVNIVTGTSTHVLSVPIAAVLYRPLAGKSTNTARSSGAGLVQVGSTAPTGAAVAGAPGSTVTVWILRNGKAVPVKVVLGLSDSKNMEIKSGDLKEGDLMIIAEGKDNESS
jgi:HlyD family secretion protein